RLFFVRGRQADRNVVPKRRVAHLLGQEPTLERPIVKGATGRDELRAEDGIGARIELASLAGHFASKHREALGVALIEDLRDLGALITQAKIGFIDDERPAKGIEDPEERR